MKVKAYAKLNFYLEILGKRPDGYHNLQSIMQKVDLHDVLLFSDSERDQVLMAGIQAKANNLVTIARDKLRATNDFPCVRIELDKQIPIGAGMGGGSSDAAMTLVRLNQFFELGLSTNELKEIGKTIGSDIPFFIDSAAAIVEGTGTEITNLKPIDLPYILLARPHGYISTPDVYRELKPADYQTSGQFADFVQQWKEGKLGTCFNHLQAPAYRLDSRIEQLWEAMKKTNPLDCLMTGSGNVVFAVYPSEEDLEQAMTQLKPDVAWMMRTATIKETDE